MNEVIVTRCPYVGCDGTDFVVLESRVRYVSYPARKVSRDVKAIVYLCASCGQKFQIKFQFGEVKDAK